MNILLDTCAMIWSVSAPDRLSANTRAALLADDAGIHVSAISCAEIACLAAAKKVAFTPHWRIWFDNAIEENGWTVLDIDLETVQEAFSLPGDFHGDPADRLITAAARANHVPLLTADKKLIDYPHVRTLW